MSDMAQTWIRYAIWLRTLSSIQEWRRRELEVKAQRCEDAARAVTKYKRDGE